MSTDHQRGFVNIQSTELVLLENELADYGSRAYAFIIDFLIRAGITIGIFMLYGQLDLFGSATDFIVFLFVLIPIGFYFGYYVFFETFSFGKSPGKRIVGIRVVKTNGASPTFLDALSRNILRFIDALPFGYGLSFIVMMTDKFNRRIGDILSETLVIHDKTGKGTLEAYLEERTNIVENEQIQVTGVDQLTEKEQEVARKVFIRASSLKGKTRDDLLKKFYDTYRTKLHVSGSEDPEEILNELYRQL